MTPKVINYVCSECGFSTEAVEIAVAHVLRHGASSVVLTPEKKANGGA